MVTMNANDPILGELNPGERLRWSGQPQQGFMFRLFDIYLIPFSLFWGGISFFLEYSMLRSSTDMISSMISGFFGLPFVLVALYLLFSRFLVDITGRRRTFYGVTGQRATIVSGLFSHNVRSMDLKKLPEININIRKNGKGTITFGAPNPMSWFHTGGWPLMGRFSQAPSFELIDDVRSVYQIIKDVQQEHI